MKKILFITTSNDKFGDSELSTGCYFSEITIPYTKFIEEGFEVDFASPEGGKIPLINVHKEDPLTQNFLKDTEFMEKIEHSHKISEITKAKGNQLYPEDESFELKDLKLDEYMAIYLPGGWGLLWDLPVDFQLQDLIREFYESGGIIGAVGQGPATLLNIILTNQKYLVEDKEITCISNNEQREANIIDYKPFLLETKLIERGAIYSYATDNLPYVKVDQRLVTGQNPASSEGVALEMLRLMKVSAYRLK